MCRPERPEPDVRGLLEPARRDRRGDRATSGSTPATSAASTTTASSTSSTARRTALRRRGENISSFEMEKTLFGARGDRGRRGARGRRATLGEDDVKVTVVLQAGAHGHRRGALPLGAPSGCRTSRSRATSSSAPTCRATRSGGCSSTSSATTASPSTPGTARPPASRSNGGRRTRRTAVGEPANGDKRHSEQIALRSLLASDRYRSMRKCRSCGYLLLGEATACGRCGAPLVAVTAPARRRSDRDGPGRVLRTGTRPAPAPSAWAPPPPPPPLPGSGHAGERAVRLREAWQPVAIAAPPARPVARDPAGCRACSRSWSRSEPFSV